MALSEGTQIGPYTVGALNGQGGMGEVYQACDTKLDRDVALKVLPEAFTSDPDRLVRFEREAKPLASPNHHGIAAIYGLEESAETKALVLELAGRGSKLGIFDREATPSSLDSAPLECSGTLATGCEAQLRTARLRHQYTHRRRES